jgi:hypothetical protein
MREPRLFIGMPIYQLGEERSTEGLVRALRKGEQPAMRTAARILTRYPSARFDVKPGTLLSIARAELAAAFVESDCDYWLSLDQDIEFELDVLEALIAAAGDIVLATYPMRGAPQIMPLGFGHHDLRDLPVRRTRLGHRVVEIEAAGLGCALIARHVILALQDRHPELQFFHWTKEPPDVQFACERRRWALFNQEVREIDGVPRYMGEDYAFFYRVRAAGLCVECLVDAAIAHDGFVHSLAALLDRKDGIETWPKP